MTGLTDEKLREMQRFAVEQFDLARSQIKSSSYINSRDIGSTGTQFQSSDRELAKLAVQAAGTAATIELALKK